MVCQSDLLIDPSEVVDVERDEEHEGQQGCGLLTVGRLHQSTRPQALLGLKVPDGFFQILILITEYLGGRELINC